MKQKCSPGFIGHEDSDRMFPLSGKKGQVEVRGADLGSFVLAWNMKVGLLGRPGRLLLAD